MAKSIEVTVSAAQYEDEDDCLAAAERDVRHELRLAGYDLSPRWTDDNRESITLVVPAPGANDVRGWERLRAFQGYAGG
jgi:hypothetical protein